MLYFIKIFYNILMLTLLTSCATMIRGTTQEVSVNTTPQVHMFNSLMVKVVQVLVILLQKENKT